MERDNFLLELVKQMSGQPALAKAIISVSQAVEGVEKNSEVGAGRNAYKGVKDQDVKKVFRKAFVKAGLGILPVDIDLTTEVSTWDGVDMYNNVARKKEVFTTAKVTYLLFHETGQSILVQGAGYGVDSQDKGAGKATTYSLKNLLIYMGLTPVGAIDDTDDEHSDDKQVPAANATPPSKKATTTKAAPAATATQTQAPAADAAKTEEKPAATPAAIQTPATKAVLTQPRLEALIKKIEAGEADVIKNASVYFEISAEQLVKLEAAKSPAAETEGKIVKIEPAAAPGKPDLGEGDLQVFIDKIAAGEPGVIPAVQEKYNVFTSQLDRMRAAMPSLKEDKQSSAPAVEKAVAEAAGSGEQQPAVTEPETGEKVPMKEKMFRDLCKEYKTNKNALAPYKATHTFTKQQVDYLTNIAVKLHGFKPAEK